MVRPSSYKVEPGKRGAGRHRRNDERRGAIGRRWRGGGAAARRPGRGASNFSLSDDTREDQPPPNSAPMTPRAASRCGLTGARPMRNALEARPTAPLDREQQQEVSRYSFIRHATGKPGQGGHATSAFWAAKAPDQDPAPALSRWCQKRLQCPSCCGGAPRREPTIG